MKTKEKQKMKNASVEELQKEQQELRTRLAALKLSRYTKQSKNVREARTLRTRLAIVSTILHEKEMYGKDE